MANELEGRGVAVTPVLGRCRVRATYAPCVVSAAQQCVVAGQVAELSCLTDLDLCLDLDHVIRPLSFSVFGQRWRPCSVSLQFLTIHTLLY